MEDWYDASILSFNNLHFPTQQLTTCAALPPLQQDTLSSQTPEIGK